MERRTWIKSFLPEKSFAKGGEREFLLETERKREKEREEKEEEEGGGSSWKKREGGCRRRKADPKSVAEGSNLRGPPVSECVGKKRQLSWHRERKREREREKRNRERERERRKRERKKEKEKERGWNEGGGGRPGFERVSRLREKRCRVRGRGGE